MAPAPIVLNGTDGSDDFRLPPGPLFGDRPFFIDMGGGDDFNVQSKGKPGRSASLYRNDDTLLGGAGNDSIRGFGGNDSIDGGPDNDSITGDGDNDTIQGGTGIDRVDGGSGFDVLSYKDSPTAITFILSETGSGVDPTGDTYSRFEGIEGSANNDSLTGNAAANSVSGLQGNDTLDGAGGNDTLIGGGGADSLVGGEGVDLVSYAIATEAVTFGLSVVGSQGDADGDTYTGIENAEGSAFGDIIGGDDGANEILGLGGADTIKGAGGADVLDGGAGADRISGGEESDTLYGREGDDTLLGDAGDDVIDGGADNDTARYAGRPQDYTVVQNLDGSQTVTDINLTDGNEGADTLISIENIEFATEGEAPVFNPGQVFKYNERQAEGFVVGTVDVTDNTAVTSFIIVGGNDQGFFAIDNSGKITLTAAGASAFAASNDFETGANTFDLTVQAGDPAGNVSSAIVTLDVTDVDDTAPQILPQTFSYAEVQSIGATLATVVATDDVAVTGFEIIDGDPGDFFDINANGNISLTAAGMASAANDFETGDNVFNLVVRASDAAGNTTNGLVTLNVTDVVDNTPPVAVDDVIRTDEDTPAVGNVLLDTLEGPDSDADGDTLTVIAVNGIEANVGVPTRLILGGLMTLNADGTFTYDPDGQFEDLADGETATDSFTYVVSDGNGGSDSATVTVTIEGVNDQPDAVNDEGEGFTTDEDSAFTTANVLANDSDPDASDALSVQSLDTTGTAGLVTDNGDGTFGYDPNGQFEDLAAGETATDSFSYEVSDGNGGSDTATVTVTITGVDDSIGPTLIEGTAGGDNLVGTEGDDVISGKGGPFDFFSGGGGADVFRFEAAAGNGREVGTITDYTPEEDLIDLAGNTVAFSFAVGASTHLFLDGADFDTLIVNGASSIDEIEFV